MSRRAELNTAADYKALEAEAIAEQHLLTMRDVARRLRCRRDQVRDLLVNKQIPCIQRGSRRYVRLGDLRRYLDKQSFVLPKIKQGRGHAKKNRGLSHQRRPAWLSAFL